MDFAFNSDGKYIIDADRLIICQSNATDKEIEEVLRNFNYYKTINPLGEWTGGTNLIVYGVRQLTEKLVLQKVPF